MGIRRVGPTRLIGDSREAQILKPLCIVRLFPFPEFQTIVDPVRTSASHGVLLLPPG